MRVPFSYFAFAIASAIASAAFADTESPETIVVSATRIPTPEEHVANSITVISESDIAARQVQTLPDILQDAPGLNVVQTGGEGGQTSVFMRGTNSNHVKVFIDGIDVSDPSSPTDTFDFGQIATADIQQIEILRGPQSGLYGSDAVGGVINIITKSGEGLTQFSAGFEGGSFDTFDQSGGIAGSSDDFHYTANIAHLYSSATPVTPLDLLTPGEKRNDDSYDNVTASTKLGYDPASGFDLGLVGRYTDSHLAFTGDDFVRQAPDKSRSEDDTLQYDTRSTAHLTLFGGLLEQTVGMGFSSIGATELSPDPGVGVSYFSGNRLKVDWQGDIRFSDAEILVVGAEHERDGIHQPVSARTSIDSGYAELQSTLTGNLFDTVSIRFDDNDRFGSKVTYRIAPLYEIPATGTKLRASVGTGFKAPTLSEMFENFPSFGFSGNPGLKPESSIGFDAGFEQSLLADAAQFGVTYFRNNIRDLIDDNATFTSYANVGKAETDGIESFVSYQPVHAVVLRADYTFTEANDEILHEELLRRPKNKASLDAKWQATPALSIDADVLYVGSWIDTSREGTTPRLKASGYTTANIAVTYDISDELTVYGRISNLFDATYQDPVGFLRPGRGVFAGVKAKI
jgi:vitamin B12 transporter